MVHDNDNSKSSQFGCYAGESKQCAPPASVQHNWMTKHTH